MSTVQELAKKRRSSWETCADAVSVMRTILNDLEEYSGVYEEISGLRKQLARIEKACARSGAASRTEIDSAAGTPAEAAPVEMDGEPRAVAQHLVAQLPLQKIFGDQALSDAFLSELLLALARESSYSSRRERQKKGIEDAKAQGIRFGAPSRPLPENFDEIRRAWRGGAFPLKEAAAKCGMAKTTFYNAVQRAEQEAAKQAVP